MDHLRKILMIKASIYVSFLVSLFLICQVEAQEAFIAFVGGGPIPHGFETYTLFLVPDEAWISKEKHTELKNLLGDFVKFGHAIGERNLAIWFWKTETEVDTILSREYCNKFDLPYRGPYIVTSSKHPDSVMTANDFLILDLNGVSSERITEILDILKNSITSGAFVWKDALNTSSISFFRFRYPIKAPIKEPIKDPKINLNRIFSVINKLPLDEKRLNIQILIVLLGTLVVSTLCTVKDKRIRFRQQKIGASATIFFLGIVCYYIIYRTIFFEYIGDTFIILLLTLIYGLIPQRIVAHIPMVKRTVTYPTP